MTTVDLLDSEHPDRIGQELVLQVSGVSKGSMYHHFEDFPEVVEAALVYRFHRNVGDNIAAIDALLGSSSTREEFIGHMIELTRVTQDRARAPFRFERARALGRAGHSDRFRTALGAEQQRLTDAFTDLFSRAQAKGWVNPTLDARALAVLVQAYTLGKVVDDVVSNPMDDQAWLSLLSHIFTTSLT